MSLKFKKKSSVALSRWRELSIKVRSGTIRARREPNKVYGVCMELTANDWKLIELQQFEKQYTENLDMIMAILNDMQLSKIDLQHPVPMPQGLRGGMDTIIKSNFLELTNFHKNVLMKGIEKNLNSPDQLRDLFAHNADKMKTLYGEYYTNYSMISLIMKNHEDYFWKLQERTGLYTTFSSMPIIHLTQYSLFFKDLAKLSVKAGLDNDLSVYTEIEAITQDISQTTDNLMAVERVTRLPDELDITKQGVLIYKGSLYTKSSRRTSLMTSMANMMRIKKSSLKLKLLHVFLFKQSVIICYNKGKTRNFGIGDEYQFWIRIPMLNLKVEDEEDKEFVLEDTVKGEVFTLVAEDVETKEKWIQLLWKEIRYREELMDKIVRTPTMDQTSPGFVPARF